MYHSALVDMLEFSNMASLQGANTIAVRTCCCRPNVIWEHQDLNYGSVADTISNSTHRLQLSMLFHRFRAHSIKPETSVTYNLQGDEVDRRTNFQSELVKKYGKGPFLLGWHEIRQIIFDSLPPGVVEFNTQVSAVLPMYILALVMLTAFQAIMVSFYPSEEKCR